MLPILLKTDFVTIYAYPFFMGVSVVLAYRISEYFFHQYTQLNQKKLSAYFIGLFLSSFVGAKVFFLIFSNQGLIDQYSQSLNFWLGGGFVFYGGLIFGSIWTFIVLKCLKWLSFDQLKYAIPGIVLGHGVGRIGCFLAGCCYGHLMDNGHRFPIQLVEALSLLSLGVYLWRNIKKKNIVWTYLVSYSIIRLLVEFGRFDEIRGLYFLNISTSQLISVTIFISVVGFKLYELKYRKITRN